MSAFDQPSILVTAGLYLLVVLAIGGWAARRTRNAKDFFIAGQGVGLVVTGLATMSAAFSGFVFLGGPGLTYRLGLASLFICLPVGFTAALLCWSVAKRLRLLAEVREVYTVPDAVLCRWGCRRTSGLAAVAVVVGTVGYLGAQLLALGVMIESITGSRGALGPWSLPVAVGIGLVVVLFYATAGGMVAGVYTDLFQGVLMVLAAGAVFAWALVEGGGLEAMARSIAASPDFGPDFLDPLGGVPVLTAFGFFFVFSVGTLGQPQMLHKFYMLDDPRKLRFMPLVVGGSQAVCILIWLGIGLVVPALVAQGRLAPLQLADDAAPTFLLQFTPGILAGVVIAGILAAIMSTADSFINLGSAALVRDLPRAIGRPIEKELLWSRLAGIGLALSAALLALGYRDLIALLGTFAFGTFAAALAPAMAVGLNWKRVTAGAASASIATGLGLNLALEWSAKQSFLPWFPRPDFLLPGVLPSTVSLATSFTVLLAVSWWQGADNTPLADDVAAVMEM